MKLIESLTSAESELVAQILDGRDDFSHCLFADNIRITMLMSKIGNRAGRDLVFDHSEFFGSIWLDTWHVRPARISLCSITCRANVHLDDLQISETNLRGSRIAGKTVIQHGSGYADLTGLQTDGLFILRSKGLRVSMDHVSSRITNIMPGGCEIVTQRHSNLGNEHTLLGELTAEDNKWKLLPAS